MLGVLWLCIKVSLFILGSYGLYLVDIISLTLIKENLLMLINKESSNNENEVLIICCYMITIVMILSITKLVDSQKFIKEL